MTPDEQAAFEAGYTFGAERVILAYEPLFDFVCDRARWGLSHGDDNVHKALLAICDDIRAARSNSADWLPWWQLEMELWTP